MPALPLLFILFLVVPLVEIYLLIEIGRVIGALPTVALCVLTAIGGGLLLRFQGLSTMMRAQQSMARGEPPAVEMLEGVALLIGGGLLLTPGFATDFVGLLCLLPWTRQAAVRAFIARAQVHARPPGRRPGTEFEGRTLEGEFRRDDDDPSGR